MNRLYDFRCSLCDAVYEDMASYEERSKEHPGCGGVATRLISAPRIQLEGITGDFPGAAIKWAKDHERWAKEGMERKRKNS